MNPTCCSSLFRATLLGAALPFAIAAAQTVPASGTAANDDALVLTPFEVSSKRDYGYRATNSLTATRAGAPIYDTPLNISVLTAEFLGDISAQNLNEGLGYVTSVSSSSLGNNGRIGGSGDGTRLRGFQISYALRNGYRRDRNVTVHNIDRVEVVKGPVSLLYGLTTPGGLINYITKRPTFTDAAVLTTTVGTESLWNAELDVQHAFKVSDRKQPDVAVRAMISRERRELYRDYEFQNDDYAIVQGAWRPLPNFNVLIEHEYLDRKSNLAQGLPRTNPRYVADFQRAVAEGRTADATRWYGSLANWANDVTARTGVRPPLITGFLESAFPAGRLKTYNLSGPDARFNNRSNSTSLEASWTPGDAISVRYGANLYAVNYFEIFNFSDRPNADGTSRLSENSSRNNRRVITTQQADVLLRHNLPGLKSTVGLGAEWMNDYETQRSILFDPVQGFSAQNIQRPIPAISQPDRGAYLNAVNSYDPSTMPPVRLDLMIVTYDRPQSKAIRELDSKGYYATYRGAMLQDRLNASVGVRRQDVDTEVFTPSANARTVDSIGRTTWTYGLNFEVVKGLMAFASYSASFIPTTGRTAAGSGARADEIRPLPPEKGDGIEVGAKVELRRNVLTGTVSYFDVKREDIASRDLQRTNADPRNADPNSPTGVLVTPAVEFFTASGEGEARGLEADLVWSPQPNVQMLFSATHFLAAEFRNMAPLQGSGRLANGTTVRFPDTDINGTRFARTPDYAFSVWGKYVVTAGLLKNVSLGLGLQYRDPYIVFGAPSTATGSDDPYTVYDNREFLSKAYTLVDVSVGYETRLFNRRVNLLLSVKNAFNQEYLGGTYTFGEPRRATLSARLAF